MLSMNSPIGLKLASEGPLWSCSQGVEELDRVRIKWASAGGGGRAKRSHSEEKRTRCRDRYRDIVIDRWRADRFSFYLL
jgi:hypothetical protein